MYIILSGSDLSVGYGTSRATPITSQGFPLSPIEMFPVHTMRLPSGLSPGNTRRASVSLTTVTSGAPPAISAGPKSRPCTIADPKLAK